MQTLVDELLIGESIGGRMLDPRLDTDSVTASVKLPS